MRLGACGEDGDPSDKVVGRGVESPREDLDDGGRGLFLGGSDGGEDGFDGVAVDRRDSVVPGGSGVKDGFCFVGAEGRHSGVGWELGWCGVGCGVMVILSCSSV